jgi:FtsP/CotA-like multicopper oxidase with cupredoxin domain
MHTHGLWVSPAGNGDNVLISVDPGVAFTYEYNIPPDHPAGTFWYHAHLHGSTGPQVSSGMAGPLIIRGDRAPEFGHGGEWAVPGDLDLLLPAVAENGLSPVRDRILLLQQIAYACRDAAGAIKTNPDGTWRCDPGDVGGVEPGPVDAFDQLTPASWPASGRYTAINGAVAPRLPDAAVGAVERWRLIHGGVRASVKLRVRKMTSPQLAAAFEYRDIARDEREEFVAENCNGDTVPVYGVATDGLTRPALDERTDTWLQPGYREDVLVSFDTPGWYCLVNGRVEDEQAINTDGTESVLIGRIYVAEGGAVAGSARQRILDGMVAAAQARLAEPVRGAVVAALGEGRLDPFVEHPTIEDAELTGFQSVAFRIYNADPRPGVTDVTFEIGELAAELGGGFTIRRPKPYDPDVMDRVLTLDGVDEWILTSLGGGGHPFHIHVNPFQIMDIMKYAPDVQHPNINPRDRATWVDVSGPGDPNLTQYANLKGVWKDTIFTLPGHLVRFRTRYQRYIGDFVLHCHILDHEDQGMMENLRIAVGNGHGGVSMAHH